MAEDDMSLLVELGALGKIPDQMQVAFGTAAELIHKENGGDRDRTARDLANLIAWSVASYLMSAGCPVSLDEIIEMIRRRYPLAVELSEQGHEDEDFTE